MENLNLADLKLSQEDSGDIIELLAKKGNIKKYKRKSNDKSKSKNKERIDDIRKDQKDLSRKLSRKELEKIRENLYNIEKRKQFD